MGADLVFRWRKSSSSAQSGACVELGMTWRKSSFSAQSGDCVELGADWRKSSFSGANGECVELARGAVRDSKNPAGPTLHVDLGPLVTSVKSGRLTR